MTFLASRAPPGTIRLSMDQYSAFRAPLALLLRTPGWESVAAALPDPTLTPLALLAASPAPSGAIVRQLELPRPWCGSRVRLDRITMAPGLQATSPAQHVLQERFAHLAP